MTKRGGPIGLRALCLLLCLEFQILHQFHGALQSAGSRLQL